MDPAIAGRKIGEFRKNKKTHNFEKQQRCLFLKKWKSEILEF
jgi:hypothetical protein